MDAADRLADVNARIAKVARAAGRSPTDVTLIAVSKTHSAAAIQPLIDAGQLAFGENRMQETAAKWPPLRSAAGVELHLVGRLQSNKAAAALQIFDAVHSLDRMSLVLALAAAMRAGGRRVRCFVQVNVGEEPQKGGCAIDALSGLVAAARDEEIPLAGLMCVPPVGKEPAPYFALLAKLAARHGLGGLSMGMSSDFETAIELGATHIRVGSAVFGDRDA